eukprot:g24947.t1
MSPSSLSCPKYSSCPFHLMMSPSPLSCPLDKDMSTSTAIKALSRPAAQLARAAGSVATRTPNKLSPEALVVAGKQMFWHEVMQASESNARSKSLGTVQEQAKVPKTAQTESNDSSPFAGKARFNEKKSRFSVQKDRFRSSNDKQETS